MQVNISIESKTLDLTIERIEATASDCSVAVSRWCKTDGTQADAVLTGSFSNIGDLVGYFEPMKLCFTISIVGGEYSSGT